jgi:signal transduction histidine kinase
LPDSDGQANVGTLRANILLVDDEPSNLVVLEAILGDLGQNLVRASSGEDALRRLLDQEFAVVLLDVRMPGLDGLETARLIRDREKSRLTPIIFLSAYDDPDSVVRAYELGAVDYLQKPLVPVILRAKVNAFVEQFRRTEQIKQQAEQLRQLERREFERQLAEEKHRWVVEQLREDAKRKDEFLAVLGHELRNPLAPLRNAAQILRLGQADPAALAQAREIIDRQVAQLARLVDDLLDVSRITRGKIALRKQSVELAAVVAQAVETCRPLLDARRHALHLSLPKAPVWLEADPARLNQVITNLLTNAARYSNDDGQIWLRAECQGAAVSVQVRDTGIGIPADMLDRVFELFTQVDSSRGSTAQGGLGIGLTLARSLVELHGGTITAASPGPGQGSEFTVRLPVLTHPDSKTQTDAPRGAPQRPLRVLVVDDNQDGADSLACLLRLQGHEVRTARDGPSALVAAQADAPEVVLLDIGLPGMDGYEVARSLRQQFGPDGVRLVAVTGYGQLEDRRRSQCAGIDHHLVKPVDLESLQTILLAVQTGRGCH